MAKLLLSLGYSAGNWSRLEGDLRAGHLGEVVINMQPTIWGQRYEIVAAITGPPGDTMLFRSVWQIELETVRPRLITMYPE
jgi:hypothetical protein